MDYDYRNTVGPPYDSHTPMYRPTVTNPPSSHKHHGSSLYPRVGQPGQPGHTIIPPPVRTSSSTASGLGIRVAIKPEYQITPPPQLLPQVEDIPRCTFQFDFEFERKILAEAGKESSNWSRLGLENVPSKATQSNSSSDLMLPNLEIEGSVTDPIVGKYIASGLSREAVTLAVTNYGDNPTKVREFVNGYNLLREMGFPPNSIGEALATYDNDTDKALAHFLNSSS